jgi:aldehyde:ferredoxin oxidoreductase
VIDSIVACKFAHIAVADEYFARALTALTGVEYPTGELIRTGERIWNLERLYNLREGFSRSDDSLPPRLINEPATGASEGWVSHLEPMLVEYYRARGWDENGVPKPQKLEELGLIDLVGEVL